VKGKITADQVWGAVLPRGGPAEALKLESFEQGRISPARVDFDRARAFALWTLPAQVEEAFAKVARRRTKIEIARRIQALVVTFYNATLSRAPGESRK
jgi:hypothetical protein